MSDLSFDAGHRAQLCADHWPDAGNHLGNRETRGRALQRIALPEASDSPILAPCLPF